MLDNVGNDTDIQRFEQPTRHGYVMGGNVSFNVNAISC